MTGASIDDSSDRSSEHPEPVVVAAFAERGEAEVALAKLRAYDVEAFISDEAQGGALPVEGDVAVYVVVRPDDADAARELLSGDAVAVEAVEQLDE